MRHQMLQKMSMRSGEKLSASKQGKVPMKISLQDQLLRKSALSSQNDFNKVPPATIKQLVVRNAKGRGSFRNEPMIGSGLASETDANQMSPEVQMSYTRLKQLKQHENLTQTIKQSGLEYTS